MVATPLFSKKKLFLDRRPGRDPGCDRWRLHWGQF